MSRTAGIEIIGMLDLPGWHESVRRVYSVNGICPTIPTASGGGHIPKFATGDRMDENTRIRKLTPRECLRLMDYTDEEIDRLMAGGFCKTALYRFAGNSIVVGTLAAVMECAIFPKA